MKITNDLLLKIFAAIGFVAMVAVNYLANALPIGGVTTGQASDAYGNLFTPAGVTFSIWGLIYLLLFGYVIYQFGFRQKEVSSEREKLLASINLYFVVNTIANISWIFAWHHGYIGLSVLIMAILLATLIKINDIVGAKKIIARDRLLIATPFSVYFGWITVATIANITVFLVSLGWKGFGIADYIWTVVILLVGATIGILRTLKDKNIFYILVFVWAYSGILLKHISSSGFDGSYTSVIVVLGFCLVAFFATTRKVLNSR